jgi:hypothetical protein
MAVAEHLLAITRGRERTLTEVTQGRWLWERLQRALVCVLSCVLMPDHLHLMAAPGQWGTLRRVLNGFTCRFGVRLDLMAPEPAHTVQIAGRQMRYGFFNPPRAGLVEDPWCWPLSTLRDLAGAAYPCWTPLAQVAAQLGTTPTRALAALTTTADRRVQPLAVGRPVVAALDTVQAAITSALRFDPRASLERPLGRTLAVQTLIELGIPSGDGLAQLVGCSPSTVRRIRAPRHPGLDAVLRCLGDERLRHVPGGRQGPDSRAPNARYPEG